mmetsp:Transcript_10748/g.30738  ORF Transcript_10748/g.30738 Transcript_10748/m.30738 type:complete len:440 (+) Transcript_10748:515-1834(+)
MEATVLVSRETRPAEFETGIDDLDVALLQGVVDHLFVLRDADAACRVDHDAARGVLELECVDGGEEQFLLKVAALVHVRQRALHFDAGVSADHAKARARGIQQNAIELELLEVVTDLSAVMDASDDVLDAQPVHVGHRGLLPVRSQIVGKDETRVPHELRDVRRLSARSSGHVQHPLVWLRRQRHDGTHGCRALQHVMAAEVFWRGTDGDGTFDDLQPHLGPAGERIQGHAALHQCHGKILAPRFQRVGSHHHGPWFVGILHKLEGFGGAEHGEKVRHQFRQVTEEIGHECGQRLHVIAARSTGFAPLLEICQYLQDGIDVRSDLGRWNDAVNILLQFLLRRQVVHFRVPIHHVAHLVFCLLLFLLTFRIQQPGLAFDLEFFVVAVAVVITITGFVVVVVIIVTIITVLLIGRRQELRRLLRLVLIILRCQLQPFGILI